MTQFSTIVNAIMMLPVGAAVDGIHARMCAKRCERRGYELIGVVYDWATALKMVRTKEAHVIVFAEREHFRPDWTPRIEFCGEETRDLVKYGRVRHRNDGPGGGRHRRPGPAS